MWVLFIVVALCAVHLIVYRKDDMLDNGYKIITSIFLTFTLLIICIVYPCGRYNCRKFINEIQEVKKTLAEQRSSGNIENAAITQKIIQYNADLSELKYDRKIFFIRDFNAPEIDTTNFIK